MDADAKKLKKIKKTIDLMKKEGVLILKQPELEIELAPQAIFHERESTSQVPDKTQPVTPEFTDEEILLWSAPGMATGDGH